MTNNAPASVVVGQASMTVNGANQGGIPAANTLYLPIGVFSDGVSLYVADQNNNRVLIYNSMPATNNAPANIVLGQPSMGVTNANQGGSVAANTLNFPVNVYANASKLYVADVSNHRVLSFDNHTPTFTPTLTPTATCGAGQALTWTSATSMPTSINGAAYATINNVLYSACGGTGTGFTAVTNCYAFNGSSWVTFSNGPVSTVYGPVGASVGTTFYCIGGYTGTKPVSVVQAYDTSQGVTGTWSSVTNMPNKLYYSGAGVVGSTIYVIGGKGGTSNVDQSTVYSYNTSQGLTGTWVTEAPLPVVLDGMGVAAIGTTIYSIGGYPNVTTVYAYDTVGNSWTTISSSPMPAGKCDFDTEIINGKVFCIGGYNGTTYLNSIEVYDPAAQTWSTTWASMTTARDSLIGGFINGTIYEAGGYNGTDSIVTDEQGNFVCLPTPTGTPTSTPTATPTPCSLTVNAGQSVTLNAASYSYCSAHIISGGTLYLAGPSGAVTNAQVTITVSGDFTLDSGASIVGLGGYAGGVAPGGSGSTGTGTGGGIGNASAGGGGGGHETYGGNSGGGSSGGVTNDFSSGPTLMGSGGGAGNTGTNGGNGGALLTVIALSGTAYLNGVIQCNAQGGLAA